MRVSYNWLKEYVDVPVSPRELADRFDLTGTAVESLISTGDAFDGIVVGHIVAKERHPDADTLWVTTVDVGAEEPLQIVCGAQNFEAGDKVPVATVGTVMPGGLQIKKAKLRGVVSCGMNCSAAELGIDGDASGLLILPEDAPVGMPFADYRGLSDTVLELEITPNRPDCLSVVGVAREVGAIWDLDVRVPARSLVESSEPVSSLVTVDVEDPALCPRYSARVIRGVRVGPSPDWLAERVVSAGARSVNNVVDVTNYILFELGQPLHAFDLDRLSRDEAGIVGIRVRAAHAGERIVTLDGETRSLTDDMVVIADASGPVALAGVMGGLETEVTETTVDVLLESATFSTAHTSRTSRNLGLVSESSMRFERGVDPRTTTVNLDAAAALLAEVTGGTVCQGVVDVYPAPVEPATVMLRLSRLEALVGERIPLVDVIRILTRLGCSVATEEAVLAVTVPTFRPDLTREADIVEEVLRIWGMERVVPTLPAGRGRIGGLSVEQRRVARIGATLRAAGLNETMTYSFTAPDALDRLGMARDAADLPVELINPMSGEQSVMRRTLVVGLLDGVAYNLSRGVHDVHLYEVGMVFSGVAGRKLPRESRMVAGVMAGGWTQAGWNDPARALDFFDGKGVLETLFVDLGIEKVSYRAADLAWLQPGRSAEVVVAGTVVGWVGEVHPSSLARFDIDVPVVAFELSCAPIVKLTREVKPYTEVPRFPAVELDVAFVVPEDVTALTIERAIRSAGGALLDSVRLFDVFRGESVGAGHKSVAFQLAYRATDRTLSADEVSAVHERLVKKVGNAVGGRLR